MWLLHPIWFLKGFHPSQDGIRLLSPHVPEEKCCAGRAAEPSWDPGRAQEGGWKSKYPSWLASVWMLSLLFLLPSFKGDKGSCMGSLSLLSSALKGDVAIPVPPYLNCWLYVMFSLSAWQLFNLLFCLPWIEHVGAQIDSTIKDPD